jgi:hypothetical protein
MERAARQLLLVSLAGFCLVIGLGTIRASPAHLAMDTTPEVIRSFQSFHAHFDALVWLGAAALGSALRLLAPGYAGPAWAPRALALASAGGVLLLAAAGCALVIGGALLRRGAGVAARPDGG